MYAIVRAGGRQEKVAVGDVLLMDRIPAEPGATVNLPALLLVDGEAVTSDAGALSRITVTAEVLAETKGPKIHILNFKNKTGYRRRMGYRSKLTQVRVTGIDRGSGIDNGSGVDSGTPTSTGAAPAESVPADAPAAPSYDS